jgi:transposase
MGLYGGIDLQANTSMVVVIDGQDCILYQKRLRNELSEMLRVLAPYPETLQGIVVESTYNWYWLVDGLMAAGYRMHLANTTAIEQYKGLKPTDEQSDARWLAPWLRLGILPEGYS